jgi:hypothetical protein
VNAPPAEGGPRGLVSGLGPWMPRAKSSSVSKTSSRFLAEPLDVAILALPFACSRLRHLSPQVKGEDGDSPSGPPRTHRRPVEEIAPLKRPDGKGDATSSARATLTATATSPTAPTLSAERRCRGTDRPRPGRAARPTAARSNLAHSTWHTFQRPRDRRGVAQGGVERGCGVERGWDRVTLGGGEWRGWMAICPGLVVTGYVDAWILDDG